MKIPIKKIGIYGQSRILQILFNAHKYLKANFIYLNEAEQYPDEINEIWDIWRIAFDKSKTKLVGDCDEFMLMMIYILYKCEIPLEKLYLSVCHAPTSEGHAVPQILIDGQLWQFDNMLKCPIPSFYGFNGVGYYVSKHANGIFNMKEKRWRVFEPENIGRPKELWGIETNG